jgi:hypothetical protein
MISLEAISSKNNAINEVKKIFRNNKYKNKSNYKSKLIELFKFHTESQAINLKKSQHLKSAIITVLKDMANVMKSHKNNLFSFDELPTYPGIWDDDIMKTLFRNTLVFLPMKVRNTWRDYWPYFMRDASFTTILLNSYDWRSNDQKAEYKLAFEMYSEYERLRYMKRYDPFVKTHILNPTGPWEVHFWSPRKWRNNINETWSTVLPRSSITGRLDKINQYLRGRVYPETTVTIHSMRRDTLFWKKASMALEFAINQNLITNNNFGCRYAKGIMFGRIPKQIAFALNNGIVVGGFDWKFVGGSLSINHMCSSKLIPNIGTVLLYAAEEFARYHDKRRINLLANANAKPFYFKVGYNYMSGNDSGTNVRSTIISGSSSTSTNKNSNTKTDSRRSHHRMDEHQEPEPVASGLY